MPLATIKASRIIFLHLYSFLTHNKQFHSENHQRVSALNNQHFAHNLLHRLRRHLRWYQLCRRPQKCSSCHKNSAISSCCRYCVHQIYRTVAGLHIKSLRLVCRSLATGFLPYLINLYQDENFLTVSGTRRLTFFLDDEGINDIEELSQSRLAPFVENVLLADRVPATNLLAILEVADERKRQHLSFLQSGSQRAKSGQIVEDVMRRPLVHFAKGRKYNAATPGTSYRLEYIPVQASSRGQRK